MKNKCAKVMEHFLQLDKNQRLPLFITFHLLFCKECRSKVRMLSKAERFLKTDAISEVDFSHTSLSDIMEKLFPGKFNPKRVSLAKWFYTGLLLIICMIMMNDLARHVIPAIQIYVCIFVGIVISVYISLFIGSNLDFFVKTIDRFNNISKNPNSN